MSPEEVFTQVQLEFGCETAVAVVSILAIHLAEKPKHKDFQPGSTTFIDRIVRKARKVLWHLSNEQFALAVRVQGALYTFDCLQVMNGVGGSMPKTLRELLASGEA